jgi:hypothetical protein
MLPRPPFSPRQKKVILVTLPTASCCFGAIDLLLGAGVNALTLLALAGMVTMSAGFAIIGWPAGDGLPVRVRDRRDGGSLGRGLDRDAGRAPRQVGERPVWRAVARLMPPAAGRRWLAEMDSLLFEITAEQRRNAVHSYLLSVPRLLVMTWASELSRRARPRFRRPR